MGINIQVTGLKKSFGELEVLKGVTFMVWKGEIMAILGPNGAGKTTTINILSTLMQQDSGVTNVAGFDTLVDAEQVRHSIGLTGQFAAIDGYLTGRENMRLIGRLYHLDEATVRSRVEALVQEFDLVKFADRPARTYSGGMKRRLDLAMSLVADPPILFLDEPTTGLDPRSRLSLWHLIKDLARRGRTILLTTQYMEEADFLADNVVVIDHGIVIAEGSPSRLKVDAGSVRLELGFRSTPEVQRAAALFRGAAIDEGNLTIAFPVQYGMDSLKASIQYLEQVGLKPETAALRRPTLDDVFLNLTGHDAQADSESPDKDGAS